MQTIWIATKNVHKVQEFHRLLAGSGFDVLPMPDGVPESPESGTTFESNVMEKASFYSQFCDGWVLADDSGLCVDALGGAPGVFSARYAGPDSTDESVRRKLLHEMRGIAEADRSASMVSVLGLWRADGPVGLVVKGMVRGSILHEARGGHGFGYDPLFYIPHLCKSMSELAPEEKDAVSHRGQAVAELLKAWTRLTD